MNRREFIRWVVRGAVGACLFDASVIEPHLIKWNTFSLDSRRQKNTPLTLVQLSDLHLRKIDRTLIKLAEDINKLKPDILCLTGDAVDRPRYLPVLDEYLGMIDRNIPKFSILGNWEYWGGVDLSALKETYEKYGWQLLVNESVICSLQEKSILITGLDDFIGGDPDIGSALKQIPNHDFHVVLSHCPEFRDVLVNFFPHFSSMDVVLSGHTHGGQVNLLGFIPVLPPGSGRYVKGWYKEKPPAMYVSSGIGTSLLPLRMGVLPEVTVFRMNV
ncbi:MAG: metallophosphoesterase [Candidatus Omnitrophica bacterium]|nr:metallophosphoesterase [Candidatus Omnitrophota bacterium]